MERIWQIKTQRIRELWKLYRFHVNLKRHPRKGLTTQEFKRERRISQNFIFKLGKMTKQSSAGTQFNKTPPGSGGLTDCNNAWNRKTFTDFTFFNLFKWLFIKSHSFQLLLRNRRLLLWRRESHLAAAVLINYLLCSTRQRLCWRGDTYFVTVKQIFESSVIIHFPAPLFPLCVCVVRLRSVMDCSGRSSAAECLIWITWKVAGGYYREKNSDIKDLKEIKEIDASPMGARVEARRWLDHL